MLILEFKVKGKPSQYSGIDDAIRTTQFIRNKSIRFWMDNPKVSKYELNKNCATLAKEFPFADELNSMARQSAAERAWSAINRFYENCKKKVAGKKGFPQFQKDCRSVEYKTSGWKLSEDRKHINFTDGKKIGRLKLMGSRDLNFYQLDQIKRVRLVKRADGYYAQFAVSVDRVESVPVTGKAIGLDVGLKEFYTDSMGEQVENPRFLRKSEQRLKKAQRRVSKRVKGSKNRGKARVILGKRHLKISRQRKDHAVKLARCVIKSNDLVAYEDLRVRNLVKNHCLAKSINDASWYQFRLWLEHFGKVFGKITIAVPPHYTSQECSSCGAVVKKTLSNRTHACQCGCVMDRDHNAARNILSRGLSTTGHVGTFGLDPSNAWGDLTSTVVGANLPQQVESMNQESPRLKARGVSNNTPIYSFVDAARYLKIPIGALRTWIRKKLIKLSNPDVRGFSFTNLVEAHILRAIRIEHKIRLEQIRIALNYISIEVGYEHFLVKEDFLKTDGNYVEHLVRLLDDLKHNQTVIKETLDTYLMRIEINENGIATRLFPFLYPNQRDDPKIIVINPNICFGYPVIAGTRIQTRILADRTKAGESINDLAEDFNCEPSLVEVALKFEKLIL